MRLLELCAGTGSIGLYCESIGIEVISVDISSQFHKPTHITDLMVWDYTIYDKNHFDIVWASPPCRYFSSMQRFSGKNSKDPYTIMMNAEKKGMPLVRRCIEIIEYFNPSRWYIENPFLGCLKSFLSDYHYIVVDYCKFGFTYKKPTIIFTNDMDLRSVRCKSDCGKMIEGTRIHIQRIGVRDKTMLKDRYSIPQPLVRYIISHIL